MTWPTPRACSGKRSSGGNRTEMMRAWRTLTDDSRRGGAQTPEKRLAGKGDLTYWSILAREVGLSLDDGAWKIAEASFPCLITQGDSKLPEGLDLDDAPLATRLPTVGRRAIRPGSVPAALTPDGVTPSGLKIADMTELGVELIVERYGDGLNIEVGLTGAVLGNFLHRCFEVLGARPELIDRLQMIAGVDMDGEVAKSIASCVANFEDWLNKHFPVQSVARELPLLACDESGSIISGIADLIVETADGLWIIDHKSDQADNPNVAFKRYRPQLKSYAKALISEGSIVLGVGINWIRRGEVVVERV